MRLRLRNIETKETVKVEVPNSCSLPQFKQIAAQILLDSPSPAYIRLSLNRKDALQSEGEESLQSLGVAAGDLIFYSFENPVPEIGSVSERPMDSMIAECSARLDRDYTAESVDSASVERQQGRKAPGRDSETVETVREMEIDLGDAEIKGKSHAENLDFSRGEALGGDSKPQVDGAASENDVESDVSPSYGLGKSFSVPGFLRKVLTEQLSDGGVHDHRLIVTAVHAVMLESGFEVFDRDSNMISNCLHSRNDWPSSLFKLAVHYTLPQVIRASSHSQAEAIKTVELKFQSVGSFINVFGTLDFDSAKKSGVYRVQLNAGELLLHLNIVWANCWDTEFDSISPEKEVFMFWKTVKDRLALPLSIDLCEEAGLQLPACFMRLPIDLKLIILESLPGVDLARILCVCSELQYLGSNDELWKLKFLVEFPDRARNTEKTWKKAFAAAWSLRKAEIKAGNARHAMIFPATAIQRNQPRRWYPNPFTVPRVPRIIGGDHDIFPGLPIGGGGRLLNLHLFRRFSPPCDLGLNGGEP